MPQKFLFVFFAALCFSFSNAQAKSYSGYGFWKNSGGLGGEYESRVEVTASDFSSSYLDIHGENLRSIKMDGTQDDFSITINNQYSGRGFCFNDFCNLQWNEGSDKMEESWFFDNDKLVRMGKRTYEKDKYVLWQDQVE